MDTPLAQQVHSVQNVDKGAAETIDSPNDDGVTGLCMLEELLHPAALDRGLATRGDIGEHVSLLNTSRDESVQLQLCILTRRADARVLSLSEVVGTAGPSNPGIVLGTVDNARSVLVCTNRHFAVEC